MTDIEKTKQFIISNAETIAATLSRGDKVQLAGSDPVKVFEVKTKRIDQNEKN